jgi:mono/diheme cytochrome c family protein
MRRPTALRVVLAGVLAGLPVSGPASTRGNFQEASALRFERGGTLVRRVDRAALEAACDLERIEVDDPYHERRKVFLACPLRRVLAIGFGPELARGSDSNYFLRARDGYTKPATGARLLEEGGYLAIEDLSNPAGDGWEPIDRTRVDPGPFYVVWTRPGQNDVHRYPWPYQLAVVDEAPFESEFPHTLPHGVPEGARAWDGFAIFRRECVACHAINGEGGRVGPDLNVPRSIVEYRPAEQIKAYVRDPVSFRYTSMPAHLHLSDADLDAIVAYFEAMRARKHDPRVQP